MKKFACLMMALAMVFSLSVTAGAAGEITAVNGTSEGTVKIALGNAAIVDKVYSVDVAWKDLTFTYLKQQTNQWNPSTHTNNANGEPAHWQKTTIEDAITVKNHSNVAVTVSALFGEELSMTKGETTVEISVAEGDNLALESAAVGDSAGDVEKAPTVHFDLTVRGTATAADNNFGTITVKIEDTNP